MSGGGSCLCFLQTLPRDRNRGESMSVWNNDTTLVAQYWLRYSTTFEKIVNNTTTKQIRITKWKRVAQSKFQTSETINGGILIRTFLFSARICNIRSSCQRTTHNTTFATPTACVVVWKRRRGAECSPPLSSRANSGGHDYEFPWLSTDRFLKLLIHWEYANKRILTAFILPMTDPVFSSSLHREAKGRGRLPSSASAVNIKGGGSGVAFKYLIDIYAVAKYACERRIPSTQGISSLTN